MVFKIDILKISQNSQKNVCARVFFFTKLQAKKFSKLTIKHLCHSLVLNKSWSWSYKINIKSLIHLIHLLQHPIITKRSILDVSEALDPPLVVVKEKIKKEVIGFSSSISRCCNVFILKNCLLEIPQISIIIGVILQ